MRSRHRPIKQAQRRLWLNRILSALGWSLAAAASLFTLTVVIVRIWPRSDQPDDFWGALALFLTCTALITSVVWATSTRETLLVAATRLDVAAGLKERLSTALFCEHASDPFAQAVITDAHRLSQEVAVREHVPIQLPRSARYAGSTLLVALLFFWLFPVMDLAGNQAQREQERQQRKMIKQVEAQVKPALHQVFKNLGDKNPAFRKELEGIDPLKQASLDKPTDVYHQAIKQVSSLRQKLDDRASRPELTKVGELKKMLRQLTAQQQANSPVSALAKALAKGDFKSAQTAIKALQQELAKKPQTPEEKQRAEALRAQLKQLSDKIEKIAQNDNKLRSTLAKTNLTETERAKALENLKKQDFKDVKAQLADKGLSNEQIDKIMHQLQKRCAACAAANKLSRQLAPCARAGSNVEQMSALAAQGLSAVGQQLSDMEALQQELNQLLSASAEMNALKNQLGQSCSMCNGTGRADGQICATCQGIGRGNCKRGVGMGHLDRRHRDRVPKPENSFKAVQQRTRVNALPGAIISQKFINGEQYAGEVSDEFVEAVISAKRDVTDATPIKPLPRVYHKTRAQYFSHTAEDLPADKIEAAKPKHKE